MKKFGLAVVAAATIGMFASGAMAGQPSTRGNGAPMGKFEKFLLVAPGNPNITAEDFLSHDNSNGRAIFIPVKTTNGPDAILCAAADGDGYEIIGDVANENLYALEPNRGVKVEFVKDPDATKLEIVDRDATDGEAVVNVPEDWADATAIDLYIRALGKPGGCFQTDAYTYDGSYYFYAGTAVLKRKAGQSTFVDAGELTTVYYCPDGSQVVIGNGNHYDCDSGGGVLVDAVETNVFADVFDRYFWDITNDGVRVVQVLMRAVY